MKYCKECGHSLREGQQFCNGCGTPVNGELRQQNPQHSTYQQSNQFTPRPPLSKKKKKWLIAFVATLVILFGGYKAGEALTSKERLINKFETALVDKDARAVAKILSSHDKKAGINEETVKGFMRYFEKNPDKVTNLIKTLESQSKLIEQTNDKELSELARDFLDPGFVSLEKDGKFLIFDKYTLTVPTVYFTLSTNYQNTNLYIDGKKVGKSTQPDYTETFGPYLPGIYQVKANLKTDLVDLEKEEEISLAHSGIKKVVSLNLNGEYITVDLGIGKTNTALKGTLFINGKDVKVNPFQSPTFGPVLTDGSMKIAVEAETPWGKIKSDDFSIDSNYIYLNLGNNQDFRTQVMDQIMKFDDQYLAYFTSGNKSTMTTTTANSNVIFETDEIIKHNVVNDIMYKGKHLSTIFDLNTFHLSNEDGVWSVNVDTLEKYYEGFFNNGRDPLLEYADQARSYTLFYDEKIKNWLVDNFNVIYSFSGEKGKEVKVEKPNMYMTKGVAVVNTGSVSYSKDEIESFMNDYQTAAVNAINHHDFSLVEDFFTPDGKSYKETKDYIDYLKKKGITEDFISSTISELETTSDGYHIYTKEVFRIHYTDGSMKEKNFKTQYQLKRVGSKLKVDSLVETNEVTD
ncbi:zinc ribbon domain-containing protein [Neobacillus sp. NPDC058068]|uniref:zinc ribbon domain-containing protein n=1 Tax=Neobacillus sp. NPDC058068 TaxID=3346325 RepID=UPI0036D8B83B